MPPPLLGNVTLFWGTFDYRFYYRDDSYDLIVTGQPGFSENLLSLLWR